MPNNKGEELAGLIILYKRNQDENLLTTFQEKLAALTPQEFQEADFTNYNPNNGNSGFKNTTIGGEKGLNGLATFLFPNTNPFSEKILEKRQQSPQSLVSGAAASTASSQQQRGGGSATV